ncbi:MAG TPA: Flp pilus assembly protein CpaB [Lacipirellulaceae bacterium]
MRPKSLLLLAMALGCGLVASIGISQVMDRKPQMTLETVQIYVAKHNINLGDPINKEMVVLEDWPKNKVPRGVISSLEELENRRPRSAIIEGEPILEAKLLAPGEVADPIGAIPKGMRLKTISVDAEKSAGGLLRPGDRVDVQLFVRKDQRTGIETATSKVILQNIRVFAVDQTVQRAADGADERTIAKTVSLMLTPEQASKLTFAEQVGEVSLIPRNPDDDEIATWDEVKIEDLLTSSDDEANSRKKEQGADGAEKQPDTSDRLGGAILTATSSKPPFRMEIIEAQNFREALFDADTGRPMRALRAPTSPGPTVGPSHSPAAVGTVPGDVTGDPATSMENFPIDFDTTN